MTLTCAEMRGMVTRDTLAGSPCVFVLPDGRRLLIKDRAVVPDLETDHEGKRKLAGPPRLVFTLAPEPPPEKVAGAHAKGSGV